MDPPRPQTQPDPQSKCSTDPMFWLLGPSPPAPRSGLRVRSWDNWTCHQADDLRPHVAMLGNDLAKDRVPESSHRGRALLTGTPRCSVQIEMSLLSP